jgi:multiple sugar transport system substrate-binding protein
MPDGTMVDWTWDALTNVAKLLTIDSNGVSSGQAGFDKTKIVQYGFSFGWENKPSYWGSFWQAGQFLVPGGAKGTYAAQIPDAWKANWAWYFDGMWGAAPFVPTGAVESSADFDSGNSFASGKIGMVDLPSWYTCCVADLTKAGGEFDFGAMPTYNGKVGGRVDADTFRIWKGTKNPAEAFTVLAYLIDTGIQKLVVGSADQPPAYGAVPSQIALRGPWLAASQANFPFVKNWDTLLAGLNYPDVPSAEGYMPNINEAWNRTITFSSLMVSDGTIDLNAAEAQLVTDLTTIFNK